jgi:hypothetical protein
MTAPQAQVDQRKALLRLPRFLFRFEADSCSHPASRSCSHSALQRKATRTVSFPASATVTAQLLIEAAHPLVAKSATLMIRIRKLQSQPKPTKLSDAE